MGVYNSISGKGPSSLRDSGGTTPTAFLASAEIELLTLFKHRSYVCMTIQTCADTKCEMHLSSGSTRNLEYPVYQVLPESLVFTNQVTSPSNDAVRSH